MRIQLAPDNNILIAILPLALKKEHIKLPTSVISIFMSGQNCEHS